MEGIKITYNNETKNFNKNTTYYEISRGFNLDNNILAARSNNQILSLGDRAQQDNEIEFIDVKDINGSRIYKSGLQFAFEVALKECFPNMEINYLHSVPKGFLGEIVGDKIISEEELLTIKEKLARIISDNTRFIKMNIKNKEAIEYFKKRKQLEKAQNIQGISDKVVTLYELKGYYNYYYNEMPYSTGSLNLYDIIYLGKNRLIFVIPSKVTNGYLPEYIHYDNIINSFLEGKNWLDILNMNYVTSINKTVSDSKIRDFIKSCELHFNSCVSNAVDEIINNRNIKFVMIAGPSSSGKTTTTKRLSSYFAAKGYEPICISIDDFFLERDETPKDEFGKYDFESINALDLKLFGDTMTKLLKGEKVEIPTFNFKTGKKEYNDHFVKLNDNSILLIEGLHALNDELLPQIDSDKKFKIYLSPFIPLSIDRHNYISTIDVRLIRRIVRDNRTRGYSVNKTIDSWQSVRNGEEKNIFPFIHQADKIINTALTYEVGVLKVYVEPLLRSINIDSKYYEEARRLLNFLKTFYPIPGEYVNEDSILREFIGGRYD